MGAEVYQKKISPFVEQANIKELSSSWRCAYERLIFLILTKDYCYTPKRFVESRLFATLGLKPYGKEKMIDLKKRLSELSFQYADNASLSHIADVLYQTHWRSIDALSAVIHSQRNRTKLYNQGVMIGVHGETGTLGDFLQRCTGLDNSKLTYMRWQDGFTIFRGVGPLLIEQMGAVLWYNGIDPSITAIELKYLTSLR